MSRPLFAFEAQLETSFAFAPSPPSATLAGRTGGVVTPSCAATVSSRSLQTLTETEVDAVTAVIVAGEPGSEGLGGEFSADGQVTEQSSHWRRVSARVVECG